MILIFVYLLIALAVSFLCSVLEAVLLSTPMSFITLKENEGNRSAPLFKKLKENIDKPLSAILSLNTVAHTIGAAGVGAQANKVFGEEYFGLVSAILTFLILVLSEIIPKSVGASHWRSMAMGSGKVIQALIYITYPLVWLSEQITKLISPANKEISVSREEVSAMIDVGVREGTFDNKESKIIQNLMKLENIRVRDIMTPRIVVSTAPEDMTLKEFSDMKPALQHSRIPVYSSADNEDITGYVLRHAVFEHLAGDRFEVRLSDIKRPIEAYPDTITLAAAWEYLLESKEHIALVVDEYGSFEGIVTVEDIVETILGLEIIDEKDSVADMQEYARERWRQRREKYRHLISE